MSNTEDIAPDVIEKLVASRDLSKLSPAQRLQYYAAVCRSLGLNPLTAPFEYLYLQGRLTLYATRSCTDQLRRIHNVSTDIVEATQIGDAYMVRVRATMPGGRHEENIALVPIGGLGGAELCNAIMKAYTKALRRVTLSICGLGMLDETEIETIPAAALQRPQSAPQMPSAVEDAAAAGELESGVTEAQDDTQPTASAEVPAKAAPEVPPDAPAAPQASAVNADDDNAAERDAIIDELEALAERWPHGAGETPKAAFGRWLIKTYSTSRVHRLSTEQLRDALARARTLAAKS